MAARWSLRRPQAAAAWQVDCRRHCRHSSECTPPPDLVAAAGRIAAITMKVASMMTGAATIVRQPTWCCGCVLPLGPLALPSQCTACKRRTGNALIQPDCDSFNRFPVPIPQVLTSKAAQRLLTQLGVRRGRGGWLTEGGGWTVRFAGTPAVVSCAGRARPF